MPARKTTAEVLPAVTSADTPSPDQAIIASISVRMYNPLLGATYQITFSPGESLDAADDWVSLWIEQGYKPCISPDAPLPKSAPEATKPASTNGPIDRRTGARVHPPKADRLVLPFALKGEYKGWTLQAIEAEKPSAIDWLAQNAYMEDIRKAAQKLINQRDANDELF